MVPSRHPPDGHRIGGTAAMEEATGVQNIDQGEKTGLNVAAASLISCA